MPKAVVFDVDGTLVDTNDLHAKAWVEAFRQHAINVAYEDVRQQMGKGGDQLLPVFLDDDALQEKGKAIAKLRAEIFTRDYLNQSRAFPGVRALLTRIKTTGQTVALASSGEADEVQHHVQTAEIADLVDASTSSADAERTKPHPDIFQAALERIAPLTAADAIVVGDTPYDAQAAAKAGLRTVGLLCGGFSEAELTSAGCVAVYRDPADLLSKYEASPISAWA